MDKEVENLQKRATKMVEAPEGKALEKGDLAIIDFAGTIDGEAFDGGEGKGYPWKWAAAASSRALKTSWWA